MSNTNTNRPATQGQLTKNERAARLIKQNFVLDMLYAVHKDETTALAAEYEAGDKAEIKNDNGVKIGTVSMSNPNKKAVPDDDSVLLGYATGHGYEVEDMLPADGTPEAHEIIDLVYAAGREDLLTPSVTAEVKKEICAKVLESWEFTGGKELPLGWEIRDASTPKFTVAKGRGAKAKAAFEAEMKPIKDALEQSAFREIEEGK